VLRSNRGIVLTEDGELLLEQARGLLGHYEQMVETLRSRRGPSG
jgi:DNA-binding transcriptional LysR family regulator